VKDRIAALWEHAIDSLMDDLDKMLGRDPSKEEAAIYCTDHRIFCRAESLARESLEEPV
jgi:hypothetical protein